MQGLPFEHGWVADDHMVHAVLLFGLAAFGADRKLEETKLVRDNPWLTCLLG